MGVNLEKTAAAYAEVFAESPWNEWTKCQNCQTFFGLTTKPGDTCSSCGQGGLVLAYPLTETMAYIQNEIDKPGARLKTETIGGDVIGFAWGYENTPQLFSESKYRKPTSRAYIKGVLKQALGLKENDKGFYISEVGVVARERGKGYGGAFVLALLNNVKDTSLDSWLRTNKESPMVRIAVRSRMRDIGGFTDPENTARKIFIKAGHVPSEGMH